MKKLELVIAWWLENTAPQCTRINGLVVYWMVLGVSKGVAGVCWNVSSVFYTLVLLALTSLSSVLSGAGGAS